MALTRSLKRFASGLILASLLWAPALADNPPLAELWFQTSTEYRALCYQTYRTAEMQFDRWADLLVKGPDGKAYLPGSDKPVAIVLDLDETVIDNSGFQAFCVQNGVSFNDELWDLWIKFQGQHEAAGPAVPGAPEFLNKVEAMGVTPLYVSNRTVGAESATAKVLGRLGINLEGIQERILLRLNSKDEAARGESVIRSHKFKPGSPEALAVSNGEGKKQARRLLLSEKYNVVAYFGDQLGDFLAYVPESSVLTQDGYKDRMARAEQYRQHWGTTWYVLPNPMYGYWGPGQTLPAAEPANSLRDYGFGVYVRAHRAPKDK